MDFRGYYQHISALHNARNSAFAAKLGGKGPSYTEDNTPDSQQRQDSNQQQRPSSIPRRGLRGCACGAKHRFINCPYLVPSKRLPGWKKAPDVRRRVDDAMSNPEIKALVENILAERSSATTTQFSYAPVHRTNTNSTHLDTLTSQVFRSPLRRFRRFTRRHLAKTTRSIVVSSDSGADTHVFNEIFCDRLTNIWKAGPSIRLPWRLFVTYCDLWRRLATM